MSRPVWMLPLTTEEVHQLDGTRVVAVDRDGTVAVVDSIGYVIDDGLVYGDEHVHVCACSRNGGGPCGPCACGQA